MGLKKFDTNQSQSNKESKNLIESKQGSKKYEDPYGTTSKKSGFAGVFETIIRTFRGLSFLAFIIPIFSLYILSIGVAASPAVFLFKFVQPMFENQNLFISTLGYSFLIPFCYFTFAIALIFVVPFFNWILPLKIKPMRTTWFSLEVIPWYYHNALVQLVRYTVLDIMTPSPLNLLFFKMMGMKVGKNVLINTSNISDPALITLEDNVTVGGSATIFAHYGMKGYLIVAPVIIKKGANLGLKSSIMGDVVIEEGAMVPPHEIVLPKTVFKKGDKTK